MIFIDFVLKSCQTTITVTCALKNQYEHLPDWLGKYVGMIVKGQVITFFLKYAVFGASYQGMISCHQSSKSEPFFFAREVCRRRLKTSILLILIDF